jgi:hypothetical protein
MFKVCNCQQKQPNETQLSAAMHCTSLHCLAPRCASLLSTALFCTILACHCHCLALLNSETNGSGLVRFQNWPTRRARLVWGTARLAKTRAGNSQRSKSNTGKLRSGSTVGSGSGSGLSDLGALSGPTVTETTTGLLGANGTRLLCTLAECSGPSHCTLFGPLLHHCDANPLVVAARDCPEYQLADDMEDHDCCATDCQH